jgi:toxin ParE1/3/4
MSSNRTSYKLHAEAAAELDAAASWYEQQREGLELELLQEFRQRVASALQLPGTGSLAGHTPEGAEIRRYRLRRFKRYAILVAKIGGIPTVIAFEHSSRRPGYWRDRVA